MCTPSCQVRHDAVGHLHDRVMPSGRHHRGTRDGPLELKVDGQDHQRSDQQEPGPPEHLGQPRRLRG